MQTKSIETLEYPIDPLHILDINNPDHSSYLFKTEHYNLLITRFFILENRGLKGVSLSYLIFGEKMYKYDAIAKDMIIMELGHISIAESIESQLNQSEHLVKDYLDEIDKLEDSLYMRKIPPIFLDLWFDLKKDLTRIERILDRAEETLQEYIEIYEIQQSFPREHFINLLEHIQRYARLTSLHSSKLDTLYNYYNSLKNDKINNNIYTLTVLSGVFLPLNLVVGFFGMNTQKLFFSDTPLGTIYVTYILIGMLVTLLLAFPIIQFLERYILRRLLGRFSLYNILINNIKKMTQIK